MSCASTAAISGERQTWTNGPFSKRRTVPKLPAITKDFDRGRRAWAWDARIAKKPGLAIARRADARVRRHPRSGPAVSGRHDQSGADRGCLAALPPMWRPRATGRDSVASRRRRQVASWPVLHGLWRRASRPGRAAAVTTAPPRSAASGSEARCGRRRRHGSPAHEGRGCPLRSSSRSAFCSTPSSATSSPRELRDRSPDLARPGRVVVARQTRPSRMPR